MGNFCDIEQNSKRQWGQNKKVSDKETSSKQFTHKANDEIARQVIQNGDKIIKFCDISIQLNSLKHMLKLAEDWDEKYSSLIKQDKPDGKILQQTLKEA